MPTASVFPLMGAMLCKLRSDPLEAIDFQWWDPEPWNQSMAWQLLSKDADMAADMAPVSSSSQCSLQSLMRSVWGMRQIHQAASGHAEAWKQTDTQASRARTHSIQKQRLTSLSESSSHTTTQFSNYQMGKKMSLVYSPQIQTQVQMALKSFHGAFTT